MTEIFDRVNSAALPLAETLLARWLPGGRRDGDEYIALNPTRDDNALGSFRINITSGKWLDFATNDKGGDLVALRAFILGVPQIEAARDIAETLGIETEPTSAQTKQAAARPVKSSADAPMKQTAGGASGGQSIPDTAPTKKWEYINENDESVMFVFRWDLPDGKKIIRPAVPHPDKPGHFIYRKPEGLLPLYRANLIQSPDFREKWILIVEGEKCVDAVLSRVAPRMQLFPTCWAFGASSINATNWHTITGRNVILLPDNDIAGRRAMLRVGRLLEAEYQCSVSIIQSQSPRKKGWDVGDWDDEADGDIYEWLKDAFKQHKLSVGALADAIDIESNQSAPPPAQPAAPEPAPHSPPPDATQAKKKVAKKKPVEPTLTLEELERMHFWEAANFRCIGFTRRETDSNTYLFLSHKTGSLFSVSPRNMSPTFFIQLDGIEFWHRYFKRLPTMKMNGVEWDQARYALMERCHLAGRVDMKAHLRGRGVWKGNDGKVVVHCGNRMWHGDGWASPTTHPHFIMERLDPIRLTDPEAASKDEIQTAFNAIRALAWRDAWMGRFLHGWLLAAPFSGLIKKRPHLLITGASGTGKSTTIEMLVEGYLGEFINQFSGGTTSSGFRRTLGVEAIPVRFDEDEPGERGEIGKQHAKEIANLARISYQDTNTPIVHGDGQFYLPRSMIMLTRVRPGLDNEADRNRFVICELRRAAGDNWQETFNEFLRRCGQISPQFWCRAFWWVYRNFSLWQSAEKTFRQVYEKDNQSPRRADTLGTIFALSFVSLLGREPTIDDARKFIGNIGGGTSSTDMLDAQHEEFACMDTILSSVHAFTDEISDGEFTRTQRTEMTIAEMIVDTYNAGNPQTKTGVAAALRRFGIKITVSRRENDDGHYVAFANTGEGICELMEKKKWGARDWREILLRIPGAYKSPHSIEFAGRQSRFVALPMRVVLGEDDNESLFDE